MGRRLLLAALTFTVAACAPVGRYAPKPTRADRADKPIAEVPDTPRGVPPGYVWMPPEPGQMLRDAQAPIQFIHADSDEWSKLQGSWNVAPAPHPVGIIGPSPLAAAALAAAAQPPAVKIKVPLGLDPIGPEQLPDANPPTVGKWELGKRLFFDDSFLHPPEARREDGSAIKVSCATCHVPERGFTDGLMPGHRSLMRTPTLVNVVYGKRFFWDGRACCLEEMVQRVPEDERGPSLQDSGQQRHIWPGVVVRLRSSLDYDQRFREVFGTPPTQDAIGKALATYLRTVLAGNSLHDRAEQVRRQRKGQALEPGDYEKVLDDGAIRAVLFEVPEKGESPKKEEVAKQLHTGYTLFHGKGRCAGCHSGAVFRDDRFHNMDIDSDDPAAYELGKELGRFAALSPGRKDVRMIGAYRTPTLRGLTRIGAHFHNGIVYDRIVSQRLFSALSYHFKNARDNPGLKEEEVRALVMFLKALDGDPVDPVVTDPQKRPEKSSTR